jgi:hypothetical protein
VPIPLLQSFEMELAKTHSPNNTHVVIRKILHYGKTHSKFSKVALSILESDPKDYPRRTYM